MKNLLKGALLLALVVILFLAGGLIADKNTLGRNVLRLHVVADSDSETDQNVKLQVRDAVVAYLQPVMESIGDKEAALSYLQTKLRELEVLANDVLKAAGTEDHAMVTLAQENFDTRDYETFSLPAGIYDSLRITIGSGEGKNWWCVVFPTLCMQASGQTVEDTAVAAGFNSTLVNTLQKEDGYELRFFFLDCIGKLENFFEKG